MRAMKVWQVVILCIVAYGFTATASAQGLRGGRGPDDNFAKDRDTFHALLKDHKRIERQVKLIDGGVETKTTSKDEQVVARIKEHVAAMKVRVEKKRPIRRRDPLFGAIFRAADKIKFEIEDIEDGVVVRETSDDEYVTLLIRAHAKVVSLFVEHGFAEAQRNHAVPDQK